VAKASISHALPEAGASDGDFPLFDFDDWTMLSVSLPLQLFACPAGLP
jgi:hypothetical protein